MEIWLHLQGMHTRVVLSEVLLTTEIPTYLGIGSSIVLAVWQQDFLAGVKCNGNSSKAME
jgi:hypothetical protein